MLSSSGMFEKQFFFFMNSVNYKPSKHVSKCLLANSLGLYNFNFMQL